MLSGGLTTGGAGTPVVGSDSGGLITVGSMDDRKSIIVVLMESGVALVAPTVLFLPSTVTVAKPLALPEVRLNRPPPTFERPTLELEEKPRWLLTGEAVASAKMAACTAAWPRLDAWTCQHEARLDRAHTWHKLHTRMLYRSSS